MLTFSTLLLFIFTIIVSLFLNKFLIKYPSYLNLIDTPNTRSMHKVPKTRAGGIAIFLAFILSILIADIEIDYFLILSFFVIFFLGLIDDYKNISSKTKLIVISLVSCLLFFYGFHIASLGTFFGINLSLNIFFSVLLLIFAISGFVNAMNLIDGLDGLSSGVSIVILLAFLYLGLKYNDSFLFYTSLCLIASLIGFLFCNWYPSSIFMGDSGSLSLGFIIAVLSVYSIKQNFLAPVTILLIAAIPILDTLIVMTRRISNGINPFSADKTHIHHIILRQQSKDVKKTVKILILLQVLFTYIGLGFKVRDDLLILVMFLFMFVLFYKMLTLKKTKKKLSK